MGDRFAKSGGSDTSALTSGRVPAVDRKRPAVGGIDTVGHAFCALVAGDAVHPGGPHRHRQPVPPDLVSVVPSHLQPGRQPGPAGGPEDEAHWLLAASYGQWRGPGGLRVPLGPARPAAGRPRGPGFHRGLGRDDRGRARPRIDLPRVGPQAGDAEALRHGLLDELDLGAAGRGGLGLHLRGPAGRGGQPQHRASRGWSTGWARLGTAWPPRLRADERRVGPAEDPAPRPRAGPGGDRLGQGGRPSIRSSGRPTSRPGTSSATSAR